MKTSPSENNALKSVFQNLEERTDKWLETEQSKLNSGQFKML